MRAGSERYLNELIERSPVLKNCQQELVRAAEALIDCFKNSGKLLVCGNGGSAADALHITGELMKGFVLPREIPEEDREQIKLHSHNAEYIINNLQRALPVISLVSEISLCTAYMNDKAADLCFAQQVYGYGTQGDVLLAISTSGNSKNVLYAAEVAHSKKMKVIGLTGEGGGSMFELSDILIAVPEHDTYKVQELHLPIYHALCLAIENEFFGVQYNEEEDRCIQYSVSFNC